jgi:hypothetical protein
LVAALIHLIVMPEHFKEWWGYGTFFLVAAIFQGAYGPALLRWRRRSLLYLGIAANLGVIVLWLVTRTAGVPFFGPHAGEVEDVGALDLAATGAELALVLSLLAGLWLSRRPGTVLPVGVSRRAGRGEERTWLRFSSRPSSCSSVSRCGRGFRGGHRVTPQRRPALPGTCQSTTPRPSRWPRSCATRPRARR